MTKFVYALDVLVICPLYEEFSAIRKEFGRKGFRLQSEVPVHHRCDEMLFARSAHTSNGGSIQSVCVIKTIHQGVLRTACTATELVEKLRPKMVISFGIAGLIDDGDYGLGDVCVPEQIYYYEPAKDTETKDKRGYSKSDPKKEKKREGSEVKRYTLPTRETRHIPYATSRDDFNCTDTDDKYNIALDRPMASGEKLIAARDSDTITAIKRMQNKILGVEMEAAGVAEACKSTPAYRRPSFVVIKGFSDLTTAESKNPDEDEAQKEQERQRLDAAKNAAHYLGEFLLRNRKAIETIKPAGRYINSDDLKRKTSRFKEIVKPSSNIDLLPDEMQLQRPFLVGAAPIIYHMMIGSSGLLSWVDLYYLIIQRQIRDDLGFFPHVFISEPPDDAPSADLKNEIDGLIERVFGGQSFLTHWSSDIEHLRIQHKHYAEQCRAVNHNFFLDLASADENTHGHDWMQHKTDRWLVFMIWLSRVLPVQCVLAFERRRELYEKLRLVPGLDPIIVYGKVLRLANTADLESRFSQRVRNLGISAESMSPMIQWFNGELRTNPGSISAIVNAFTQYFDQSVLNSLRPPDRAHDRRLEIRDQLTEGCGDHSEALDQDLVALSNTLATIELGLQLDHRA